MWNGILDILKDKVKQGVEVRVMYDDMGSFRNGPGGLCQTAGELSASNASGSTRSTRSSIL
jgi:phosphatidylserine/phosphatidylglycerophosphate/cardiolipin synthase-like enzyme